MSYLKWPNPRDSKLRPSTRAITKRKGALEKELREVDKALVEKTAKFTAKTQATNDKQRTTKARKTASHL